MGQKKSVLKVTSRVTVPGDCGAVDAIKVSYGSRTCCGSRRRQIASFSFARDKWLQQLSPEGMLRNVSADVATVHVGKLSKKDGTTPVRVSCLAGKVSVFRTQISLADLLARLKYTEGGGKAVLSFSLAGRRLEATGPDGLAFTALFCNGMRLDNGGAQHLSGPPQQNNHHQPDHNTEPHNGTEQEVTPDHGVEDVMGDKDPSLNVEGAREEVMGEEDPSFDEDWETEEEEVMGEEDPSLDVDCEKVEEVMGKEGPSLDGEGEGVQEGQSHVRGSFWDHVGDCAAVVALGLVFYHAWVEYNTHW